MKLNPIIYLIIFVLYVYLLKRKVIRTYIYTYIRMPVRVDKNKKPQQHKIIN